MRESAIRVDHLIQPLFVSDREISEPVESMPNVRRLSLTDLLAECKTLTALGIPGVAIFPCIDPALKDAEGSQAFAADNILFRAIREIKAACPGLLIITDVAMDPYTSHGHDGLLAGDGGDVLNDKTVEALQRLALLLAKAGADWVAPSDMMDGRIRAIRETLDAAGFEQTGILSYAVKYASAFYGPFRDAVGSKSGSLPLDKRTYQMDPANVREALREIALDEAEGADVVMVKPAGPLPRRDPGGSGGDKPPIGRLPGIGGIFPDSRSRQTRLAGLCGHAGRIAFGNPTRGSGYDFDLLCP